MRIWYKIFTYLFFFFKIKKWLPYCKNTKKKEDVLLLIKILLYGVILESGIFIFTNTKIGSTLVCTNVIVKNRHYDWESF